MELETRTTTLATDRECSDGESGRGSFSDARIRRGEWASGFFRVELKPKIEHLRDLECGNGEMQITPSLSKIRERAPNTETHKKKPPGVEALRNKDYTEQDSDGELRRLANGKAHGGDGVLGEEYKATSAWAIRPIMPVMGEIKERQGIPISVANGGNLYIFSNKGERYEFGTRRPIWATPIKYEIGRGPIGRKLTKLMHIVTRNAQFGYKEGISTTDAEVKIEKYIRRADTKSKILKLEHKS